jgi:hypothetical protein
VIATPRNDSNTNTLGHDGKNGIVEVPYNSYRGSDFKVSIRCVSVEIEMD